MLLREHLWALKGFPRWPLIDSCILTEHRESWGLSSLPVGIYASIAGPVFKYLPDQPWLEVRCSD